MIEIKEHFRKEVEALYEFDFQYGSVSEESTDQFTGGFWHQEIEILGKVITYFFAGSKLFGYEYT